MCRNQHLEKIWPVVVVIVVFALKMTYLSASPYHWQIDRGDALLTLRSSLSSGLLYVHVCVQYMT